MTGDTLDETVPTDALLTAMSDARRRFVVSHLRCRSGPVPIRTLARALKRWERTYRGRSVDADDVAESLRDDHLPLLGDADLVRYDPVADTVEYCGGDRCCDLLTHTSTHVIDTSLDTRHTGGAA